MRDLIDGTFDKIILIYPNRQQMQWNLFLTDFKA